MRTKRGRPWLRFAVAGAVLGGVVLGVAGLAALVVRTSIRLTNPPGYQHPGAQGRALPADADPRRSFGFAFQEVSFPTVGGATLRGWLVPGAATGPVRAGIVAAHARGGDRLGYLDQLPLFQELGLTTLLFDMREHGLSDGAARGMSMGYREAEDVATAVRYMKDTVGLDRVAVIGHSLGGSSVILAAAQEPRIDAVIADSSIARFDDYVWDFSEQWIRERRSTRFLPSWPGWWGRLVVGFTAWRIGVPDPRAPADVIDRISPRPILLIHGTNDGVVFQPHAEKLYARARQPKELWIAEGGGHNSTFYDLPDEYRRRVSEFLARALS